MNIPKHVEIWNISDLGKTYSKYQIFKTLSSLFKLLYFKEPNLNHGLKELLIESCESEKFKTEHDPD